MKRHTPPRLQHRTAGVDSSAHWEFEPGQRVMTREGLTGIVSSIEDGFVAGNEHYIVDLDHGLGGGQYHASELRTHRESTGAAETKDPALHVASDDYPMLADILVERPPLERTASMQHESLLSSTAQALGRREAARQRTATLLRIVRTAMAESEVEEVAATLLELAHQEEPDITRLLNQVADDRGGALEGLQFRFKKPDSLERKLWDRVNSRNINNQRDLQASISDVLRYTMVFPPNIYSLQVRDALYQIEEAGYPIIEEENYWGVGPYSALHYLIGTRSGLPVEIQMHTVDSFDLKYKVLHNLYEEFREDRTPLHRKQELYDLMTSHWDNVDVPEDVLMFPELKAHQRPASKRRVGEAGDADPFVSGAEAPAAAETPARDLSTLDDEDLERRWEDDTFSAEGSVRDWLNDKLPERMQDRAFNQASFDWCRFRRDQRCYYPKQLHDRGTAAEGFPVWVPEDRGFCPRHKWTEQQACPVSEPGPNSNETAFFPDATVPYEQGGQRAMDWSNPHSDYVGPVTAPGQVARPRLGAVAEDQFLMHYTSAWRDVQSKAARIRRSGGVRIISAPEKNTNQTDYIVAEVLSDSGTIYQTRLMRVPGSRAAAMWECGCAWGHYAWGRSGRWKKFEGRMCSHALAVMYEAQSQEGFGGDGEMVEQQDLPLWRYEDDEVQTRYPAPPRKDNWRVDAALHEGNWRPARMDPDYELAPIMVIGAEVTSDGFRVRYRGERREVLRVDPDTHEVLLDIDGEKKWVPTAEVRHPRFHQYLGLDPYDDGEYVPMEKGASLRTTAEERKGCMVAIRPPDDILGELMATGSVTEEWDNLHITLAYIPEAPDLDRLREAIDIFVRGQSSFGANLQGYGTFLPEDGPKVLYASVDGPRLNQLREELVDHLRAWDIEVADDHAFTPHLTLGYDDAAVVPDVVPSEAWVVDQLIVAQDDDWTTHDLGGPVKAAALSKVPSERQLREVGRYYSQTSPDAVQRWKEEYDDVSSLVDIGKLIWESAPEDYQRALDVLKTSAKEGMAGVDPSAELAFTDRLGRCYELAGRYILENQRGELVHGSIQGAGAPRIAHAWVIDPDGEVFDGTMGEHFPNFDVYRAFANAEPVETYTADEAMAKMLSEGHWGPWHDRPWGLDDHHDQQFVQDARDGRFASADDAFLWEGQPHRTEAMANRSGHPEVDAAIEAFLDETLDDLGIPARNLTPSLAHGYCVEVSEQFVEFAKARGLKAYVTHTDLDEMGYEVSGPPQGEVLDADGNITMGHYAEHAVASIYVDGQAFPIIVDFTASQYGYGDLPKVSAHEYHGEETDTAEPGSPEWYDEQGIADFERQENQDDPFDGVTLDEDDDGHYVRTHRARSESYPSPEDIPDHAIEFIRSTGAVQAASDTLSLCSTCWSMSKTLMRTYVEGPVSGICDECGNHSIELSVYASKQTEAIVTEDVEPALPQTLGDEEVEADDEDYEVAGVDDPVTAEGSRSWLMSSGSGSTSGGAGPSDSDIAMQARKVLAAKTFTPEEQAELIGEGADGLHEGARNLTDLDISGTHYEALERVLETEDNEDEDILWGLDL